MSEKPNQVVIEADNVRHVRKIPSGMTAEEVQAEYWQERAERQQGKKKENQLIAEAKNPATWRSKEIHEMNRYELEEYASRLNPPLSYERRWPLSTGIANINAHREKWGIIDKAPMVAPAMARSAMPTDAPPKRKGGRPPKIKPSDTGAPQTAA